MKREIKIAAIVFAVVCGVFAAITVGIKSSKEFKVTHFAAVETVVGSDGRSAAGSPEVYQVKISPSLTWEKGDNGVKLWRGIGLALLVLTAVYVALCHTGVLTGSIHLAYVGFALALGSYIGAYSSAYANNYKELSATEYNAIKDNQAALTALFDKPLIK